MPKVRDHSVSAITAIADRMLGSMNKHPVALRLHAEVNRLRQGAEALDSVNASRSPLDTPAAHALKVAKMARSLSKEMNATINRSGALLRDGLVDAQRRIDEKVDLKPSAFAEEIRAVFRGMSGKDRMKLLGELVDANRGPELAALVKAPSILTGLSDDQRAVFERAILVKHAGAEVEEQDRLQEIFEAVLAADRAATDLVKRFTDPNKLAEIERADAAATAAGEAFVQSLQ